MITERIPLPEAAAILGCDPQFLRVAMQQGRFKEIGFAAKRSRWVYYINRRNLYKFLGKEANNRTLSGCYKPTDDIKNPKAPPPLFSGTT